MRKWILLFLVFVTIVGAQDKKKKSFIIDGPQGWRGEHIPFPLSFAPDIKYRGFEELCFAPGMFKPKSGSYFSYVFVMKMESKVAFSKVLLEDLLLKYYKGLCAAVAKSKKLKLDLNTIQAKVSKAKGNGMFTAQVDWYDPFVTGKELTLYFDIATWHKKSQSYLFANVAPFADKNKKIWQEMSAIRSSFMKKYK